MLDSPGPFGQANQRTIDEINNEINKQFINKFSNLLPIEIFYFDNNNIIKNKIRELIKDLDINLRELQDFYGCKICLGHAGIKRTYPSQSQNKEAKYSNFFHNDIYIFTMFKIWISLHDINIQHGPTHFIKKKYSRKFIKLSNYRSRNNYNREKIIPENYYFKNTSRKGEIFLTNTSELLHRAGTPQENYFRDIIELNFVAIPEKNDEFDIFLLEKRGVNIFGDVDEAEAPRIYSKPKGTRNLIKLYNKYRSLSS